MGTRSDESCIYAGNIEGQTVLNAVANTDLVLASRMEVPASSECSTTPMQCERVNIDAETNG